MSAFRRRSLQFRLTVLFAGVSAGVLLALGLVIASLVEHHFAEMDYDLLEGKVELVSQALAADGPDAVGPTLDAALVGHHGLTVTIEDSAGRPRYRFGDGDFAALPAQPPADGTLQAGQWTGPDGRAYRGLAHRIVPADPGATPWLIRVSADLAHHEHFMHDFKLALSLVVGIAVAVSGLLGWVAARRGLAPLAAIRREAAAITASRLDRRLSEEAIPAELAEVVRTLNDMLARLEDSFRRLSDFSSDLAHELRTPVSNLLTQTQVTLGQARSVAEYQDILASNSEEFERLSKMIADMLFLAKADNELVVPERETVDLRREVDALLDFYGLAAEEAGVALAATGAATAMGDRLMLRRAIGNLLSNALRHTPRGGEVAVRLGLEAGQAVIAVENQGAAIPPEHLPRLFDRFYRADPSRHRHTEGVGLGLAITRSILRAHGGAATAASADGRTTFTLRLPAGH